MPISKKEVEHIADLARLKLSEKEKVKFQKELGKILEYIDQLKELDVENVQPTSQVVRMENVLREDKVKPSLSQEEALSNAPDKEDGFFKVPRVI